MGHRCVAVVCVLPYRQPTQGPLRLVSDSLLRSAVDR